MPHGHSDRFGIDRSDDSTAGPRKYHPLAVVRDPRPKVLSSDTNSAGLDLTLGQVIVSVSRVPSNPAVVCAYAIG